ncbi:MAG TPA: DMT family transporter, partial [Steroidobacteraceae bacterium]
MKNIAYLLGIASGLGLTLQIGMNSKLRTVLQNANSAAFVSFLVGTVALVVLLVATRTSLPDRDTLASVPVWAWFGGFLGAFNVAVATVVASQLGTASLLGLALLGQLAMAMVADHFGWMGLPEHP